MITRQRGLVALLAVFLLVAAACSDGEAADNTGAEETGPTSAGATGATTTGSNGEAPSLEFVGPNGEVPAPPDQLSLTDEEIAEVRSGDYSVAYVWHEASPLFQTLERNVTRILNEWGVEVVASTDAEFDAAQQAANVETVLALNPDVIITIPVDPVAAAEAFRPAVEQGVKLVIVSVPPEGYVHGEDFVGIATGNIPEYGKIAAELLGDALGGQGEIGWIFHDAEFWVTNMRDQAFKDWLEHLYPDTEVVDEAGFSDPARTGDIATAMLTRNPDLDGIYVAWSTAAAGVLEAIRSAGRSEVKVVTNDLEEPLALDMCQGGNIVGVVANPDNHESLALLAAYGILDKPAPEMVAASPIGTTPENIVEGWNSEFLEDPLANVVEACSG